MHVGVAKPLVPVFGNYVWMDARAWGPGDLTSLNELISLKPEVVVPEPRICYDPKIKDLVIKAVGRYRTPPTPVASKSFLGESLSCHWNSHSA